MLRAGALLYTIGICLIIGILTSSLILYNYYSRLEFLHYQMIGKVALNANSGINLLLSNPGFIAIDEKKAMDLFGEGTDSVLLERKTWGVFEVAISEAFTKNIRNKRSALIGYRSDTSTALYLSDRDKPLSLCGKTVIKGECSLPRAGVKRAYIEGQAFVGERMIQGQIQNSEKNIPDLHAELIGQVQKLLEGKYAEKDSVWLMDEKGIPDTLMREFDKKTLYIVNSDAIVLSSHHLAGNIIVVSGRTITVHQEAFLQDVILVAPQIVFMENFTGNVQAFASDSIALEKHVTLAYPSAVGLITWETAVANPTIRVGENVSFSGVLFAYQRVPGSKNQVKINIDKDAIIQGLVYSSGLVDLKGTVFGSVYTNGLILSTPSSVYENHLLNAVVDVSKLSRHFLGVNLIAHTDKSGIVKWLY